VVALSSPAAAFAKGFTRVVLVGADGSSFGVRADEAVIDGLLSSRGSSEAIRGGYVRLFFTGPGNFPTNPARYYPDQGCVALDWPSYETSCARVDAPLVRLLRRTRTLAQFHAHPTVLAWISYHGGFPGLLKTAAALKTPVELALDRRGRPGAQPRQCYPFSGRWQGPAATRRPRRFFLCAQGVYADQQLFPLARGVWAWFRLNVGAPPSPRAAG